MVGRVVAKFCPRKPIKPGTWSITGDATQVHRNSLVHHLRLSVRLWMECRAHAELDPSELEDITPHMSHEDRVPITDNRLRKSMEADNVLEEGTGLS